MDWLREEHLQTHYYENATACHAQARNGNVKGVHNKLTYVIGKCHDEKDIKRSRKRLFVFFFLAKAFAQGNK